MLGRFDVLVDGQPLPAKAWPRAIDHFDLIDEATLTPQIDRQFLTFADQPVDAEVLTEAVLIDQPDRHHVNVVAFGHEMQCAVAPRPVPIL